jgi:hypothetical protein
MSLLLAKNVVSREDLSRVPTPDAVDRFKPIPHAMLAEATRTAISNAGLEIIEEEHALGRGGLRYFGGFALRGEGINSDERNIVLGLRNAHDKTFAASICVGNRMLVCDNLCFSSDIKLARRHTTNILNDIPRVLAQAVSRVVSHWVDMGNRIFSYKQSVIGDATAADLLVKLVDSKAFPARDIYNAIEEFRKPRHAEFEGNSLWSLYNSVTENLKNGDLTKLPARTMVMQSVFDRIAGHNSIIEIDAEPMVNLEA